MAKPKMDKLAGCCRMNSREYRNLLRKLAGATWKTFWKGPKNDPNRICYSKFDHLPARQFTHLLSEKANVTGFHTLAVTYGYDGIDFAVFRSLWRNALQRDWQQLARTPSLIRMKAKLYLLSRK